MCPLIKSVGDRLVVVGSKNPAKISAVTAAAQRCFPHLSLKVKGETQSTAGPPKPEYAAYVWLVAGV